VREASKVQNFTFRINQLYNFEVIDVMDEVLLNAMHFGLTLGFERTLKQIMHMGISIILKS